MLEQSYPYNNARGATMTTLSQSAFLPNEKYQGTKLDHLQTRFNSEIDRLIEYIDDDYVEDKIWLNRQRQAIDERVRRSKSRSGGV
jgi:hypothetical protein